MLNTNQILTLKGRWKIILRDDETKEIKGIYEYDNIVPNVGLNAIADQLANQETETLSATYVAVGTDSTTPAAGDTTLGAENTRVLVSSNSTTNNVATIQGYFNASQANTTLKEMGLFGDGSSTAATGSADTGILFSHVAISVTKSASEDMICQFTLTITN